MNRRAVATLVMAATAALAAACSGKVTTDSGTGASGNTSSTTTTSSSSGQGGACGDCGGFDCCEGACINSDNDILHCGDCTTACSGPKPYCDHGTCGTPACNVTGCGAGQQCCDQDCCSAGELCCSVPGPIGEVTSCTQPSAEGTCPLGCLQCICASPDTPIATPHGDRPIASLAVGDLVYSVERDASVIVPIVRVNRVAAHDHHVVELHLASGAVLDVSPGHPTADGRTFGELRAGDRLDGVAIVSATVIPYVHPYTYDILPASASGAYVAGGVLIGSTLHGATHAAGTAR